MIDIRALQPDEWPAFRDFRLMALQAAPGVYLGTYEESRQRTPEEWRAMLAKPGQCIFGLFDVDRMIGLTSIFTSRDDPTGATAQLAMSFILPEYRDRKLSRLLYEARIAWARAQPDIRRIVVSHRASNETSRRANQAFGFAATGRTAIVWPDGVTEDEISYELALGD